MKAMSQQWQEELLEQVAQAVVRRGMEVPAILFLEMHKPLANLLGHAVWMTMPIWALFWGVQRTNALGELLSDPTQIERLIRRIEALSERKNGSPEGVRG
jgi:predicted membrane-bound dolichyl-phosphate-mannose-protein mannosyltransferase